MRWTPDLKADIRRRWADGESQDRIRAAMGLTRGQFAGARMRLGLHSRLRPEQVVPLSAGHPALTAGRTIFPGAVAHPHRGAPILKSGRDSPKLGAVVTRGAWAGMPVYSLTLEERATCPATCHHWRSCFGNSMPHAARNLHGPELEAELAREFGALQRRHPRGFVVRAHVLGDFYSVRYVRRWERWLDEFPALHAFGYTAWPRKTRIGAAVDRLADLRWDRFAIRLSSTEPGFGRAVTIRQTTDMRPDVIICPAQTGRTESCSTCALCWAPAARAKTIAFILHGKIRPPGRRKRSETMTTSPWTAERIEQMKGMWAQGISTAEIGRRLGGLTKNQVIGKARRLGLPEHPLTTAPRRPGAAAPMVPGSDL